MSKELFACKQILGIQSSLSPPTLQSETGAPREREPRSYHERYHKQDMADTALSKRSPVMSLFLKSLLQEIGKRNVDDAFPFGGIHVGGH